MNRIKQVMKPRSLKNTKSEIEVIYIHNQLCYEEAKLKELENWKDNAYETVENQNQIRIPGRWVYSLKQTNKGSNLKACLVVARGFEQDSLNTFEKESSTASKDTLKTLLSPIITNNWNLNSIDKNFFYKVNF